MISLPRQEQTRLTSIKPRRLSAGARCDTLNPVSPRSVAQRTSY